MGIHATLFKNSVPNDKKTQRTSAKSQLANAA
jgi:hypothetical protein